jgi:hypothetical protein
MITGVWMPGKMIIDSAFGDDSITNRMLIERAISVNVDIIVPKDYPGDIPSTIDSINEFFAIYPEYHNTYGEIDRRDAKRPREFLIPLQYPYANCFCDAVKQFDYFALGGLVGLPEKQQLKRIKEGTKLLCSCNKRVHLFGIYPTGDILQFIWDHPDVIYSLDTSVPEFDAKHGKIMDVNGQKFPVGNTLGKHTTHMRHILARYNLEMLSARVNYRDLGEATSGKGGIAVHVKHPPKKGSAYKTLFPLNEIEYHGE